MSYTPPAQDLETQVTKLTTTMWGAYGTNGLNGDVKNHSRQIGELYDRDEKLREYISEKFETLNGRLLSLTITVAVAALGIIGALLATLIHH